MEKLRIPILILLVTFACLGGARAQKSVYFEDFQGEKFPGNITLVNNDKQIPTTQPMGGSGEAWIRGYHPGDPTATFAMTSSKFDNSVQADRWMILPAIKVPVNGVLRWKVRSSAINPAVWEDYEVLVSEKGIDTGRDFKLIFKERAPYSDTSKEEFTPWSHRETDLTEYEGKEVRIAFRAMGVNGWLLFVDDIEVTDLLTYDIGLVSLSSFKYNNRGKQNTGGRIMNRGLETINSFEVICTDKSGRKLTSERYTGLSLATNDHYDFELPGYDLTAPGIHDLKCVLVLPNGKTDQDETNNSKEFQLVIVDQDVPKKVLAEFYTGTWCGHCPKGVITFKKSVAPDRSVIPVFVHNRDFLELKESDSLFQFMPGGYPSVTFDRFNMYGTNRPAVSNYSDDSYAVAMEKRKRSPSPVLVGISHKFDPVGRKLDIEVKVKFTSTTIGDFRINCMLTESNITSSVLSQANYANLDEKWPDLYGKGNPLPDYTHDYVLRKLFGGPWGLKGLVPIEPKKNEEMVFSFSMVIPDDWKANDINIIAYVSEHQEHSHLTEVLNAEMAKLTGVENVSLIEMATFSPSNPEIKGTLLELTNKKDE